MADPFGAFDWPYGLYHEERTSGGYATRDGRYTAPTRNAMVPIKGHVTIGPFEEHDREGSDHILSGRAKQIGLAVEKGKMLIWTSAKLRRGSRIRVDLDETGNVFEWYVVVHEDQVLSLIEKFTGARPKRRRFTAEKEMGSGADP